MGSVKTGPIGIVATGAAIEDAPFEKLVAPKKPKGIGTEEEDCIPECWKKKSGKRSPRKLSVGSVPRKEVRGDVTLGEPSILGIRIRITPTLPPSHRAESPREFGTAQRRMGSDRSKESSNDKSTDKNTEGQRWAENRQRGKGGIGKNAKTNSENLEGIRLRETCLRMKTKKRAK